MDRNQVYNIISNSNEPLTIKEIACKINISDCDQFDMAIIRSYLNSFDDVYKFKTNNTTKYYHKTIKSKINKNQTVKI